MTDPSSGSRSERLDRAIHALLSQTPEIEAAAVVSFDGLPMAAALPPSMDEDRVAAMSAALLSLGERAAQGLGRGELSQVYIEGDNGTVFLISADDEAVLVAVATKGSKVGMMLFELKRAAALIANVLRSDDAPFIPEQATAVAEAGHSTVIEVPTGPLQPVPAYVATEPPGSYGGPYDGRASYGVPPAAESAASYEPLVEATSVAPGYEAASYLPTAAAEPVASPASWAPSYAPSGSLPPATWS